MAPTIRFFRGTRGKRIAYAIDGDGPLLVFPAWWVSNVEHDFDDPAFRGLFTRLAGATRVVRYDRLGVGLSDREPTQPSLDEEVANLEALVAELGAEKIALFGQSCGGPPAIAYAARHPERVSHLVLYGSYACGPRLATDEVKRAMVGLVRASWGLGAKALADLFAPDLSSAERQHFTAMQRAAASPETAADLLALVYQMDVTEVAAGVRVPTLVLHRKDDRAIPFDHGRDLAAQVPGATFVPLPGNAHLPWVGDWAALADAVLEFLAPGPRVETPEIAENHVVRQGEVWSIGFAGRRCHLKHARGLADVALLLSHPGEEIAAAQLMDGVETTARPDPILDERARAALRERLRELDERIAGAEAAGDAAAAVSAGAERDALMHELRAATGLGGRRRALADPGERARKAVSARIRESIDKLRTALPELARHLDESITTGTTCAYRPAHPIRWHIG